jgi:hypothetical protein
MTESKKPVSTEDLKKTVKTGFEIYAEVMDVYDYHYPLTAEKARKITDKKWVSLVCLKELLSDFCDLTEFVRKTLEELLSDFGDLAEYDNDDVITLVNGLKRMVEATLRPEEIMETLK